jgi:hypothetical protein
MAAGLGFKDFVTGEVLTAADVDGYLMQGVWVFASAAARDAAVTSPQEGNFAYLKDTNVTTYYTGSAWANLDTTGMTNPMTTTGDTIYSSSGSTPARLGIGSTGQVLTVAAGIPSWATPASGAGMTFIKSETFSAVSSVSFNNVFTSTYRNYLVLFDWTGSANNSCKIRLRASGADETGSNYNTQRFLAVNTSTGVYRVPGTSWEVMEQSVNANGGYMYFFNPQTSEKTTGIFTGYSNGDTAIEYLVGSNIYNATTSFDGFTFFPSSGTATGAIRVYGLANS